MRAPAPAHADNATPAGQALHHFGGLPPAIAKAIFLSSWLAFAAALFMLNRQHGRPTHRLTPGVHGLAADPGPMPAANLPAAGGKWKLAVYFVAGLLGGLLTTVSGSGMDLAGRPGVGSLHSGHRHAQCVCVFVFVFVCVCVCVCVFGCVGRRLSPSA